jgi:hypothetical protein
VSRIDWLFEFITRLEDRRLIARGSDAPPHGLFPAQKNFKPN